MSDKIENFDQVQDALARLDRFNLSRTPNFEPRRGPSVPRFTAAKEAPLLFLPIQSGLDPVITHWLASLDGVDVGVLETQFSQKTLRQWRRKNKGNRSFTVVQHPVARAYDAFCKYIFPVGDGTFPEIRKTLRRVHKLPLPGGQHGQDFTADDMRTCFIGFLEFLRANLSGQTSIRVDASWASQTNAVQGLSEILTPDLIVRQDRFFDDLAFLAASVGWSYKNPDVTQQTQHPFVLSEIYNDQIEDLAKSAYGKDYLNFGFKRWDRSI